MLLVFGFVREVAVGFQVCRYHAVAGRDISVGSVIARPDAVEAEAFELVFAAAIIIAAVAVTVVHGGAVHAFGVGRLVKAQLVQVVAAFVIIAAEPAGLSARPNAVGLFAATRQCSQPAAQTVVSVTPQGVAVVGRVQKYPGVIIGFFLQLGQIPVVALLCQCGVYVPQTAGVELFALKGQFAAGIGDQNLLVRAGDFDIIQPAQVFDLHIVGACIGVCDRYFVAVGFA